MLEFAHATEPAKVRNGELRNSGVRVYNRGQIVCLASGLGPPRLWGYGLDAVFEGLDHELSADAPEGLASSSRDTARFDLSARLHRALESATARLRTRVDSLVERQRCDVGVLLLTLSPGQLLVLSSGPMRAYLRRTEQVKRVNAREDRSEGLLKLRPAFYTERLEPGDLLIAGSQAAFGNESMDRVATALSREPKLPVDQMLELLNRSAVKNGQGVSSLALRLPQF